MMIPRGALYSVCLASLFILFGCDSFSISDHFSRASGEVDISLSLEKNSMLRYETIGLNVVGGTAPYTFQKTEKSLYPGTENELLGAFDASSFTAGGAIGTITLTVLDAAGNTASADVTVVPPPPANVAIVYDTTAKEVTLTWLYAEPDILSNFMIRYTTDGINFYDKPVSSASTEDVYKNLPQNKDYYFSLYAVSGAFRSAPVERTIHVSP